jgi:hypothetical protein
MIRLGWIFLLSGLSTESKKKDNPLRTLRLCGELLHLLQIIIRRYCLSTHILLDGRICRALGSGFRVQGSGFRGSEQLKDILLDYSRIYGMVLSKIVQNPEQPIRKKRVILLSHNSNNPIGAKPGICDPENYALSVNVHQIVWGLRKKWIFILLWKAFCCGLSCLLF